MKLRAGLLASAVVASVAVLASADGTKVPSTGTVAPKSCGEGVCKRTVPMTQTCTPGKPITENDGWLSAADSATGSWDANCDGTVEKRPIPTEVANAVHACAVVKGECVPTPNREYACGDKITFLERCVYLQVGDPKTCKPGGSLKGAISQRCR